MRPVFLVLALTCAALPARAQSYHQGYMNPNGVYVQPHYQTMPNNTTSDNWSTQGNVNPYTGQPGHINPVRPYRMPGQ